MESERKSHESGPPCLLKQDINKMVEEHRKRLKQTQEMSCLYSQHLYKSLKKDHFFEAQLEKYKNLFEEERKAKIKLLGMEKAWRKEREKLITEKQVVLFALENLSIKITNQENEKKSDVSRIGTKLDSRQSENDLFKSYKNKSKQTNKKIRFTEESQGKKAYQSTQILQSRINEEKKNKMEEKLTRTNADQSFENQNHHFMNNLDKLKLINRLKQKLDCKNTQKIQTLFESAAQKFEDEEFIAMEKECLQMKNQIENYKQKVSHQQEEINKLKQNINSQEKQIANHQKQTDQFKRQIEILTQGRNFLEEQVFQMTKKQAILENDNANLKQSINELEEQLKLTQEQYARRQEKQKQRVFQLQKFSKDLKLSDNKIQQFISSEFGQQNQTNVQRASKTYNEQLSYILHLCKKKQNIYQGIIQQFKERVKEDDFQIIILEKKLKTYNDFFSDLKNSMENKSSVQEIEKLIKQFKK